MRFFFASTREPSSLPGAVLKTDMHTHIIPGVDDGARSLDESLSMLHALAALGFSKVIATPHIGHPLWSTTEQDVIQIGQMVQEAMTKSEIALDFRVAAEYFCSISMLDSISKDTLLTLDGQRILMETPFDLAPPFLHQIIFEMRRQGYIPVLAHPERYLYLQKDTQIASQLREWGCEFQVNIGSQQGRYGRRASQLAHRLGRSGWIDFLGTDLHRTSQIRALDGWIRSKATKRLLKKTLKNKLL